MWPKVLMIRRLLSVNRKSTLCGACVPVQCFCFVFFFIFFCFVFLFWAAPHLGCCLPLTCQFAVKLLQEAGLSGEKSKADWVGTRLMVDLWLCGGGRKKKRDEIGSEELHERGLLGLPVQSLHASLEDWGGGRFGGGEGGNGSCHRCVSPSVCTLAAAATAETETRRFKRSLGRRRTNTQQCRLHAWPSCILTFTRSRQSAATLSRHRRTGTHNFTRSLFWYCSDFCSFLCGFLWWLTELEKLSPIH